MFRSEEKTCHLLGKRRVDLPTFLRFKINIYIFHFACCNMPLKKKNNNYSVNICTITRIITGENLDMG